MAVPGQGEVGAGAMLGGCRTGPGCAAPKAGSVSRSAASPAPRVLRSWVRSRWAGRLRWPSSSAPIPKMLPWVHAGRHVSVSRNAWLPQFPLTQLLVSLPGWRDLPGSARVLGSRAAFHFLGGEITRITLVFPTTNPQLTFGAHGVVSSRALSVRSCNIPISISSSGLLPHVPPCHDMCRCCTSTLVPLGYSHCHRESIYL